MIVCKGSERKLASKDEVVAADTVEMMLGEHTKFPPTTKMNHEAEESGILNTKSQSVKNRNIVQNFNTITKCSQRRRADLLQSKNLNQQVHDGEHAALQPMFSTKPSAMVRTLPSLTVQVCVP